LVAKTNGQELETVPVNLCQLGVVVPAGSHRVSVTVARWPEIISAAIALVAFLAALWWLGSPSIRTLFSRTSV
jgi:hypothetical protein